jgi:two-component system chemotaxis response regulator CheB
LAGLQPNLRAAIFVVLHLSPDFPSQLPTILSQPHGLLAVHPKNGDRIGHGVIYVAPPDRHLILCDRYMEVTAGPRENLHRPAIDPLFRSAARHYGSRVIGIIFSGLLDDGAVGLLAVKMRGGVAIVQNPDQAQWSDMPQRALECAHPTYVVDTPDIALSSLHCWMKIRSKLIQGKAGLCRRLLMTKRQNSLSPQRARR